MDDAFLDAVSFFMAYQHLKLYLKGIMRTLTSICDVKEACLDIPPNLITTPSSAKTDTFLKHP